MMIYVMSLLHVIENNGIKTMSTQQQQRNVSTQFILNVRLVIWERSGSVVECLTRDRRAAGSSLTGVTVLWSLSKTHLS